MVEGSRRFGAYLRALREGRRLTLEDVERLTLHDSEPITRSFLSRLERGRAQVSVPKLIGLARLYRVRVGLLAERHELDRELEHLKQEGAETWDLPLVFSRAREAGRAGQVHRALLLYEQAELRSMRRPREAWARHRARLGVARALAAGGRHRLARAALEELLGERLPDEARAWAFFFYARASLALGQVLIARAAHLSLKEVARPWPVEIEAAAPLLEGEYLFFEQRLDQAVAAFLAALDAARQGCEKPLESLCMCRLAEIGRRQGRLDQALDWVNRARDVARTFGVAQMLVQVDTEEGRIHVARRRFGLARESWARARHLARKFELAQELFEIYFELCRLAVRQGEQNEARATLRLLHHLARRLETIPPEAERLLARWRRPAAAADSAWRQIADAPRATDFLSSASFP